MIGTYIPPKFTGFVARLDDDSSILEVNNKTDESGRPMATNWSKIPKERVVALHLCWKGEVTASLWGAAEGEEWVFFHTAMMDVSLNTSTLLSRCIGKKKEGVTHLLRVGEETGEVSAESKTD